MIGSPFAGDKMLLVDIINARASNCASSVNGTCTAIWSPSKSALNAAQTSGWRRIALPSIRIGSNAWRPKRWSVGARFNITGCWRITDARTSQTSGVSRSTIFFAALMVVAWPEACSLAKMNGLNSSSAIFFGRPHWCRRRFGPTVITERPE